MIDTHTGPQQRAEVDLDHHSPEFREDPFSKFDEIRSRCPVAHSDHYEGFWTLVDYASVFEAARNDDLFNSYPSVGVPASGTAIQWNAVDIYRIRDGRISEEWAADDIAAIMSQLGVFKPPWLG